MMRRSSLWLLAACLLLIVTPVARAQSQFVNGTVVDQTGAVVAGAQVNFEDQDKKVVVRQLTTDSSGRFQAMNLQPGNYSITVEMAGFKKAQTSIKLDVNTKMDVGLIKLEVGEVTAEVSVSATTPLVQTSTMEKSFLVESQQIQQLPMNGRNWVALMKTMPGVVSDMTNDFDMNFNDVSGFHALGGRGSQNNFYLDGSPNLDVGDNQSQYTQPSIESINEFKMQQSSFNAEYGRNSGMVVAVQTKSGTSSFHGTAYDYLRNDAMDASNLFTGTKDTLRYNLFGGNVGGWLPIPKVSTKDNKKVFFFYNREMTRRNITPSGTSFLDMPSPALVSGNFASSLQSDPIKYTDSSGATILTTLDTRTNAPALRGSVFQPGTVVYDSAGRIVSGASFPNNIIPTGMLSQGGLSYLKLLSNIPGYSSLPPTPGSNNTQVRWFYPNYDKLTKDQNVARVDYNVTNKLTTYFRWVDDYQMEEFHHDIWGNGNMAFVQQQRPKPGSSWSWNVIYTISPTLASETILSYNHQSQYLRPIGDSGTRTSLGLTDQNWPQLFSGTNVFSYVPNVDASGNASGQGNYLPGINYAFGNPGWHNTGKDYAATENLSWVKRAHTLKFGFYYNRDNKTQTATWPVQGNYIYNSTASGNNGNPMDTTVGLANLLLGNVQEVNQNNAAIYPWFRFESWEGYAQDSWKVTSRLTFEYGLRIQRTTPTFTVVRDGPFGGEGTWKLYSLDLGKYNASAINYLHSGGNISGDILAQYQASGLLCDPCSGVDRGFSPTENHVSPRLGFAYDLFGDGKTALRGGYGQYVERLRQNNFNFGAGSNFPNGFSSSTQPNDVLGKNLAGNNLTGVPSFGVASGPPTFTPDSTTYLQGFTTFPVSNTMPTIYSWNAGLQHDLGHNFFLDLSYVGNRGTHLMVQAPVNGRAPGYRTSSAYTGNDNDSRPYVGFGSITAVATEGMTRYNAVMLRVSRRFANRFQFNVNYTLSRIMSSAYNDDSNLTYPYDMGRNYALAGYDATHSFTLDYIIQLPSLAEDRLVHAMIGDWQLSGLTHYQSGFPITIYANSDPQCWDCIPNGTPANFSGSAVYKADGTLNPYGFSRPPDGQYGNVGSNSLRVPGFGNWDMSISKNFRIRESIGFKFQMDVFNILNTREISSGSYNTSWSSVSATDLTPNASTLQNFATPTAYRPPRQIQLGFKFTF